MAANDNNHLSSPQFPWVGDSGAAWPGSGAGLYEAAVKPSLGCIIQRLSWGSGICFQDLPPPWLATWCWLLAGGLSLSFSGLFPALLENVVTGFPQGERCVCVCESARASWKPSLL